MTNDEMTNDKMTNDQLHTDQAGWMAQGQRIVDPIQPAVWERQVALRRANLARLAKNRQRLDDLLLALTAEYGNGQDGPHIECWLDIIDLEVELSTETGIDEKLAQRFLCAGILSPQYETWLREVGQDTYRAAWAAFERGSHLLQQVTPQQFFARHRLCYDDLSQVDYVRLVLWLGYVFGRMYLEVGLDWVGYEAPPEKMEVTF